MALTAPCLRKDSPWLINSHFRNRPVHGPVSLCRGGAPGNVVCLPLQPETPFGFSGEIVISYLSYKDRDLIISTGSCSLQCVQINVNLASFSYWVFPETRNRIETLSSFAARYSPEGLLQRGLPIGCWKRGAYGSLYSLGFLSMGSPPAAFSLWFKTPALAD